MEIDPTTLAWLVPLVAVLTQVVKSALRPADRFVPLLAVGVGLALAAVGAATAGSGPAGIRLASAAIHGIVAGLSACGLYDAAGKPAIEAVKRLKE